MFPAFKITPRWAFGKKIKKPVANLLFQALTNIKFLIAFYLYPEYINLIKYLFRAIGTAILI
jgi:hypothetical protein